MYDPRIIEVVGPQAGEVSIFTWMVFLMEISGNKNGNKAISGMKKRVFSGEFEPARKLVKSPREESLRYFLGG
jgi:hypothetical protein